MVQKDITQYLFNLHILLLFSRDTVDVFGEIAVLFSSTTPSLRRFFLWALFCCKVTVEVSGLLLSLSRSLYECSFVKSGCWKMWTSALALEV